MTKRTVHYTAFNIRLHPHKPSYYVDLFHKLFDIKKQINIRGEQYGIITEIENLIEDRPLEGLVGKVAKYTKIEIDKWFDIEKLAPAEESDTKKIVIPDNLRPNFSSFNFIFYPKNHYLVIEIKDRHGSISPRTLETYFRRLLDSEEIESEFNKVELTLVPQVDQFDKMLSLKKLELLEITLRRPNTDGLDDLEDEVLARLNEQNAEEEIVTLKAQNGLSIEANQKTIELGRIAAINGEVKSEGYNEMGVKVKESTQEHPFSDSGSYNTNEKTTRDLLVEMSIKIIDKIRNITRPRG